MTNKDQKIEIATKEISKRCRTPDGEMSVDLFVSHHQEEIAPSEWKSLLGNANPSEDEILASIVFKTSWDSEDDGVIDTYDITLPNDLTQYVISVRFDCDQIASVDMES